MPEPSEDYVSFEKALRDLEIQSEELKKLVSEGEIRAFRDGQSMKFKREDLENLKSRDKEEEFAFEETLEDDTGMVTEELSDEDTLLAEDDLVEEPAPARPTRRAAPTPTRTRIREEEQQGEPGWVTGVAVLSAVVMLYGFMVIYSIAANQPDPFGMFAGTLAAN